MQHVVDYFRVVFAVSFCLFLVLARFVFASCLCLLVDDADLHFFVLRRRGHLCIRINGILFTRLSPSLWVEHLGGACRASLVCIIISLVCLHVNVSPLSRSRCPTSLSYFVCSRAEVICVSVCCGGLGRICGVGMRLKGSHACQVLACRLRSLVGTRCPVS